MKKRILIVLVAIVACSMTWGQALPTDRDDYVRIRSSGSKGLTLEVNIGDFDRAPVMIDGKEYFRPLLKK